MSTTKLSKPPHGILKPKLTMLGYALCATVWRMEVIARFTHEDVKLEKDMSEM